jgi:uncharacterized RDD family membrane protein YckC
MSEIPPPPPPSVVPPPPPSFAYANEYRREPASFWLRFAGFLIDWLIFQAVSFVVGLVIGVGAIGLFSRLSAEEVAIAQGAANGVQLLLIVIQLLATSWFVSKKGQSPGMMAVGVRCQRADSGANLTFWPALGRSAMAWVSCCAVFLGYLWMLWDDDNQTWHDKVVDAVVVRT